MDNEIITQFYLDNEIITVTMAIYVINNLFTVILPPCVIRQPFNTTVAEKYVKYFQVNYKVYCDYDVTECKQV